MSLHFFPHCTASFFQRSRAASLSPALFLSLASRSRRSALKLLPRTEVHQKHSIGGRRCFVFRVASLCRWWSKRRKTNAPRLSSSQSLSLSRRAHTQGLFLDVPSSWRRRQPGRGSASAMGTGEDSGACRKTKQVFLVFQFFSPSNSREENVSPLSLSLTPLLLHLRKKKTQQPANPFGGAAQPAAAAAQPPPRRRGGAPIVFGVPPDPPPAPAAVPAAAPAFASRPRPQQQQQQQQARPSTPDAQRPQQQQQPAATPSEISFPAYEPLNRAVVLERARARARANHHSGPPAIRPHTRSAIPRPVTWPTHRRATGAIRRRDIHRRLRHSVHDGSRG